MIDVHEDLAKWRIKSLFTYVQTNICVEDTYRDCLNNLCEHWVNNPDKVSKFKDTAKIKSERQNLRDSIESVLPKDYKLDDHSLGSSSTSLRVGEMLAVQERRNKCWEMIIDSIPSEEPFLKKYVSSEQDIHVICSREDLEKRLNEFVHETFVKEKT